MKKIFQVAAFVVLCCAFIAWGLTTVTGQHIINSFIDSTPIGSTTPSTGSFTSISGSTARVNAQLPASAPLNTNMLGWDSAAGIGESDFLNDSGLGPGGFYWYWTNSSHNHSWSSSSPLMTLGSNGVLSTTGGFTTTNGGVVAPSAAFNTLSGTLTGSVNGNLNGNATTASALNHTPAGCSGSGNVATSIAASGNLGCSHVAVVRSTITNSCTTGSSSYSTCNLNGNWSSPMPGTPHVTCSLINASDPRAYLGAMTTINGSGVNINLVTAGSVAVSGQAECIAVVD